MSSQSQEYKESNLFKVRHTCEHIFNQAVEELYPGKITRAMGPVIEDGWYNDSRWGIDAKEDAFPEIEKRMQEIINKNLPMIEKEVTEAEAREMFKGNPFKLEFIDEYVKEGRRLSVYYTGDPEKGTDEFVDLCKGPHVKSTKEVGAFKLLSIAGAYWRGSEKNEMLTRVYGTAFESLDDLGRFMKQREEQEARNHRKLGKDLKLFTIIHEVGQGLPVWLPNGYTIRRTLEDYMIALERGYGYKHILTPNIYNEELFKISGHLEFYKDSMYAPVEIDEETYYLKPMNCPAGMMVYKSEIHSYKELPLKLGELGTVYRYEKSGELQGLQRVRGFTQNDAHIFCTPEQLDDQFMEVFHMLQVFYKDIGFSNYKFRLSLSDQEKEKFKFCGSREQWEQAESALRNVLVKNNIEFTEATGEAAFYGPKLDVQAVNVFGKEDTISTIQVDFNLPERFDLTYINSQGEKQRPFVIHRALIGSFERFFAFLIEYYAGAFPSWLSPVHVKVLPIGEMQFDYAANIDQTLQKMGEELGINVRSEVDIRSETLQSKIRDAAEMKIPYILICGKKEEAEGTVSVRVRGQGDVGTMPVEEFTKHLLKEIKDKKLELGI